MFHRIVALLALAVLGLALLAPVAAAAVRCEEDCSAEAADCCETGCELCRCCAPASQGLDPGTASGSLGEPGVGLGASPLRVPAVPTLRGVLHVPRATVPPVR
ncbi:MAG TPA: hypothetical protein VHQ65_00400 [Thermoanaerobaculia bacterium]|nr:hypothetical protein [Thermoanaerobaculia bacterium]